MKLTRFMLAMLAMVTASITAQTFTPTGSMNTARYWHSGVLLPYGKVLVAGGYDAGSIYLSSAELYDPTTGTWAYTGSMNNARNDFTMTLLTNGKVLVAGGHDHSSVLSSSELYDPVSGTWTPTGSLNVARDWSSAVLLQNGKVLIVAGESGGPTSIPTAELYDPATGTWSLTGSLNIARQNHSATLLANGMVLVEGGSTYSGIYLSSAELYNPATGTWSLTGSMSIATAYPTPTLLPNGKVLVTGGVSGGSFLASAELYDPVYGNWTLTGSMSMARTFHTATLLPNGKVLVLGGFLPSSYSTAGAELYDYTTGAWTSAGSMNTPRNHQTATLLLNGQLLIAGGINGSSVSSSAELYGFDLSSGLVAYYPFTGNANDASGNGNNGISYNTTLTSDRFGNVNTAFGFNGNNSYIDIPQSSSLDLTTNFTLTAWIYQMQASQNYGYRILDKDSAGQPNGWTFDTWDGVTGRKLRFQAVALNNFNVAGSTIFSLMQWHYVVATVSGTVGKVYLDGNLEGTGNVGNIPHNSLDIFIGSAHPYNGAGATEFFNGIIDDVQIYNRALSDSEVQALYAFENANPKSVINGNIQTTSALTATPASVPANGQSNVTATVTLLNGVNNPVPGRTVKFMSSRTADSIPQPKSVTDSNGRASATISSITPGMSTISVSDLSDNVVVGQQPKVTFTSGSVPPGNDLSNAIVQLAAGTSNILCHSIATIAIDEGGDGDYFQGQATSEKAQKGVIAFSAGAGGLLALIPGAKIISDVAQTLVVDGSFSVFGNALDAIAGSSTGLTMYGQAITNNNTFFQQWIQQNEQSLLAGVPPASVNLSSAFTNDLQLRLQANNALKEILSTQDSLLLNAKLSSQNAQNNSDLLTPLFIEVDVVGDVVGACLTGPGVVLIAEGLNAGESLITASLNQNNLNANQRAYITAVSSLMTCAAYSSMICSNTTSAFDAIAHGRKPNPPTGQILNVTSEFTGPQYNLNGRWIGANPVIIPSVLGNKVTGAFSLVTISNTSQQSEIFSVYASYVHTISLNLLGFNAASMQAPIVISTTTNLGVGQTAQLQMNYFDGVNGASPDAGSRILVYVLGYNGQNNWDIYYIGFASSTPVWASSGAITLTANKPMGVRPLDNSTSTNTFTFENPMKCYVFQNPSNQTYLAQIWVANPFAIPLVATVTQPLPSGITVLSTDGALGGSLIVWTNTIPTNGLVEETFTFSMPTIPGAQTNLPVADVLFTDGTGTNSLFLQSSVANFNGLFPVQVNGYIPNGISGANVPMQLTVTNWTGTNLTGLLTVSLADQTGTQVTNFYQSFIVSGSSGTNLTFALPGTLPPGTYLITGSLGMYGGIEQVLAGLYVIPLAPVILGFSSTPTLTNGINMMLQGPIGSNYLVEASTDLQNWTPIINFYATNSPFYFSDPAATNYNQRFYRAILFDGASVASTNTPSLVFGSSQPLTTSGLQLKVAAPISSTCVIQASTNLVNWQTLSQFVVQSATMYFTDPQATNFSQRFYRVVTQ